MNDIKNTNINNKFIEMNNIETLQKKIININNENFEEFFNYLHSSYFLKTKRAVRQLLFSIDSLVTFNRLPLQYANAILKDGLLKKVLKEMFTPNELIFVFEQNILLLTLLDEEIITIQSLMDEVCGGKDFFFFFFPEIKKKDHKYYDESINKFQELLPLKDDNVHDVLRRKGQNEDEFACFIENDDIINFRKYFCLENHSPNDLIPYSKYLRHQFVNLEHCMPSLVEYAAFFGSIQIFKFLYLEGAKLTSNITFFAIAGGNYEIIHFLEENKFTFDEADLKIAIQFHHDEIVEYIINNYDVEFSLEHFQTSILSFNYHFFYDMYEKHKFKTRLNEKINGSYLIVDSVNRGYSEVIELLSENDSTPIDFNVKDNNEFTAIQMAIMNDRIDILQYLLQYHHNNNNLNCTFRFAATRLAREDLLEILLKIDSIDVNEYYEKYGKNSLLCAVSLNNYYVVKLLVNDPRTNINAEVLYDEYADNAGDTSLMIAVQKGYITIIKILLTSPTIDINKVNHKGNTALHIATLNEHFEIINILLESPNIDQNIKNNSGLTPLEIAKRKRNDELISLFL